MEETTVEKTHRLSGLAFVFAVTTCLVAFVFIQAARGLPGIPGVIVYALAAGFGLEFVGAAWTRRFSRGGHGQLLS